MCVGLIIIWIGSLVSTAYLIGLSLLMSFYSLVFINHSSLDFAWWKVAKVAPSLVPVCGFAVIGWVGLKFWCRGHLSIWRLFLALLQAGMAIFAYVRPEGFLTLANLLS